jgi:putative ABC transport system ATP-binding protein
MLLSAIQLHHTYASSEAPVPALRGVDLHLAAGDFVALMGPSGCGKSTLLHLCGAMEVPSAGQIQFQGMDLANASEEALTKLRREKIGFVFQSFNLLPTLTVWENTALPLRLAGKSYAIARAKATAILERVGLAERAQHFPAQLSGGERQRVAIARALIHEPVLIIADEPTGSLDSTNGARVMELLLEMNRVTGVTILMATHDVTVAQVAPLQLRMKDGRFVSQDTHASVS